MSGQRRLPLESFPPFSGSASEIVSDAMTTVETYKGFLLSRNWDLVHAQTVPLAGYANRLLKLLQSRTHLYSYSANYLSERDSGLKDMFTQLSADNSAEATAVRDAMLTQLTSSLGSQAEAQSFLDDLLAGQGALFSTRKSEKSAITSEQEIVGSTQVLLAVLTNRADVESNLFAAYNQVTQLASGPEDDSDTNIISSENQFLSDLHDATIQALYDGLDNDMGLSEYTDLCVAFQEKITQRLPGSAMLVGGYLALVKQNAPSIGSIDEHKVALHCIELIRRLSMIHAYLCLVQTETSSLDSGRWYGFEKRRLDNREMNSKVPSGQTVSIDSVVTASHAEDTFVELEGYVEGLVIEDDPSPPKFSSFFQLVNPEAATSIRVRAHMFSLSNNGLSEGAFVRLNGFVRTNPGWSSNPGIDIDRVSLTQLRKTSWYDDMTHRVRSNVLLYQDGMNMFFTPAVEEV